QAPIFVEESSRLNVTDILAKSRRLQAERGLDLVVIDYLQLIEGAANEESRVLEVARISRALKAIARELEIPVVALSQLSRQIEQRGTEPMLSDLRESGALEADADLVLFLWQKDRKDREEGVVRLKLAKHRNGLAECPLRYVRAARRVSVAPSRPSAILLVADITYHNEVMVHVARGRSPDLQNRVLLALSQGSVISITRLASVVGAHRSGVSRALRPLKAAGLIERAGPTIGWRLTPRGEDRATLPRRGFAQRTTSSEDKAAHMIGGQHR